MVECGVGLFPGDLALSLSEPSLVLCLTSVLPVLCQNICYGKDKKSVLRGWICSVQSQRAPPESVSIENAFIVGFDMSDGGAAVSDTVNLKTQCAPAFCWLVCMKCICNKNQQIKASTSQDCKIVSRASCVAVTAWVKRAWPHLNQVQNATHDAVWLDAIIIRL